MHLAQPQTQTLCAIPDGIGGIKATLAHMTAYVREYKKNPDVRALARSLVSYLVEKDFRAEVALIFDYVQKNIRYLQDIADVETLQTPLITMQYEAGDCDDKATLLAALLESIGHKTRFVAAGFNGGDIEHVFVETLIANIWVPLDPTENYDMGWMPPGITAWRTSHN